MKHQQTISDRKQKRKFWKAHVSAWLKSGLNRAAYCRHNDLSYDAMTYWHRKEKVTARSEQPSAIVPVLSICRSEHPSSSAAALRIKVGSRFTVELDNDFDSTALKRVITTLEGC